jgi:hypothetical protein
MDVWMDVVNGRTEKYVHECNGAMMGGSDASPGRHVGNCSRETGHGGVEESSGYTAEFKNRKKIRDEKG